MNRGKWKWVDGEFVEITTKRLEPVHNIIQDTMNPTWHPCDGQIYESKSAFRRNTKAHGCVEVGNAEPFHGVQGLGNETEDRKLAIRDAIEQLSSVERRKEILDRIRWEQEQLAREQ